MINLRRRLMVLDGSAGEDYVDLGLPSGLLWAKGNIAKNGNKYKIGKETDYGCYFSWGNVDGHNEGEGYNFNDTTYSGTTGNNLTTAIPLSEYYDASMARVEETWRMPTTKDFQELYGNTDSEWTTINGVAGRKFMKRTDHSVYVFFPASGDYNGTSLDNRGTIGLYWSASFYNTTDAYYLSFGSSTVGTNNTIGRRYGLTVRPVYTGDTLDTYAWVPLYYNSWQVNRYVPIYGILHTQKASVSNSSRIGFTWRKNEIYYSGNEGYKDSGWNKATALGGDTDYFHLWIDPYNQKIAPKEERAGAPDQGWAIDYSKYTYVSIVDIFGNTITGKLIEDNASEGVLYFGEAQENSEPTNFYVKIKRNAFSGARTVSRNQRVPAV